jgi:hypothetical protein
MDQENLDPVLTGADENSSGCLDGFGQRICWRDATSILESRLGEKAETSCSFTAVRSMLMIPQRRQLRRRSPDPADSWRPQRWTPFRQSTLTRSRRLLSLSPAMARCYAYHFRLPGISGGADASQNRLMDKMTLAIQQGVVSTIIQPQQICSAAKGPLEYATAGGIH